MTNGTTDHEKALSLLNLTVQGVKKIKSGQIHENGTKSL